MPANGECNHEGMSSNETAHITWKHTSTVDADSLEDAFYEGNHSNKNTRSLSVGDIIVDPTNNQAYMVKNRGFEPVEFTYKLSNN